MRVLPHLQRRALAYGIMGVLTLEHVLSAQLEATAAGACLVPACAAGMLMCSVVVPAAVSMCYY